MLGWLQGFIEKRKANYRLMRAAVNAVGAEFEKKSPDELNSLLKAPGAAYEFEKEIDGNRLHFVLQEFRSGRQYGWQIDISRLPTILGIAPGYHFFKDLKGNVTY